MLQRFALAFRVAKGELTTLVLDAGGLEYNSYRFPEFVREGYRRNWTVNAALRVIRQGCSSIKIMLAEENSDIVGGDLIPVEKLTPEQQIINRLIQRPNDSQGYAEFIELWSDQLHLAGAAYVRGSGMGVEAFAGRQRMKAAPQLKLLRPDYVTVRNNGERITEYLYRPSQATQGDVYQPGEVLMLRFPHPMDEFAGLSPLEAATLAIDGGNAASAWNYNLLKKSGVPAGMLRLLNSRLKDPKRRDAVEKEFEQRYMGADNAGRVMVVNAEDAEYTPLSHPPKDMNWTDGKIQSMREICAVLGVPSIMLGDPSARTYSNMESAEEMLYINTVLPLMKHFAGELQERLRMWYSDPRITLTMDVSDIPALQQNAADLANQLKVSDWLSINEQRLLTNQEPYTEDEQADIPRALLAPFSPFAEDAPSEEEPAEEKPAEDDQEDGDTKPEDEETEPDAKADAKRAKRSTGITYHRNSRYPTLESRAALIAQHDNARADWEVRWLLKLKRYWREQKARLLESAHLRGGTVYNRRAIEDQLLTLLGPKEVDEYRKAFGALENELVVSFGTRAIDELLSGIEVGNAVGFDIGRPSFREFLTQDLTNRSKKINETTANGLRKLIDDNPGLPARELAKKIDEHYEDISLRRATSIARTEVARADSIATTEGYSQFTEQTGMSLRMEWVSARDERVRDTHVEMDGQLADDAGMFVYPSGESTRGPAVDGPAEEVINCRCVAVALFDDQEDI